VLNYLLPNRLAHLSDAAVAADLVRLSETIGGWRGRIYRSMLFGYRDTPAQRHKLERWIGVMMVIILPVAISVHTVISWVFSMTIQPMWHSSIFGPFFVAGAIFSGIAAIMTFMIILRKAFHLEDYLKPIHLNHLAKLLLVMTLLWFYFTFAEHLTTWYGNEPKEQAVLWAKLTGRFAPQFWTMVVTCFVIPFFVLFTDKRRSSPSWLMVASISVNIGMYLERFTIVVPSLVNPRIHLNSVQYSPTWVEWSILAGCTPGFLLLYLTFTKVFPIISVWEVEEGIEKAPAEVQSRLLDYYPPTGKPSEKPSTNRVAVTRDAHEEVPA